MATKTAEYPSAEKFFPDSLSLSSLRQAAATCKGCPLYKTATQTVFGEGDVDAPIFFIGEGPGETEDKTGRPFVGRAGQLLDQMIAAGKMPPVIAIMPDAPWSQRASYYVDSQYAGGPSRGGPVESAFINDLIPHVDVTYRTIADRSGRAIVGYSMGGYGAIRSSLAHPDLFGAAIVLSPAVYTPLPPRDSSARDFGAFGKGNTLFNDDIYQALNYPSLLESFEATRLQLAMFIAVGDDEAKNPLAEDQYKDIDMEAHLLFTRVSRVRGISAELRVYDGGHDWKVWRRGFSEGMRVIGKRLSAPIVN